MKKKLLAVFSIFTFLFASLSPALLGHAADSNWKTLYKEHLLGLIRKGSSNASYISGDSALEYYVCVMDNDKDAIPELYFGIHNRASSGGTFPNCEGKAYTISDGKIVSIPRETGISGEFVDKSTGQTRWICRESVVGAEVISEYTFGPHKASSPKRLFEMHEAYPGRPEDSIYYIEERKVSYTEYVAAQKAFWANLHTIIPANGQYSAIGVKNSSEAECARNIDKVFTKYEATYSAASTLALNKTVHSMTKPGETLALKANYTHNPATKAGYIWLSTNKNVATVNSSGKITGQGGGSAVIMAVAVDGSGVKATCRLTVASYVALKVGSRKVVVNGVRGTIDTANTKPFISGGRTMLPIRFLSTQMGAGVKYTNDKNPIVISYGSKTIEIKIGSKIMTIKENGKSTQAKMDVEVKKIGGKTYFPLRALSQALGFEVLYQANTKCILVNAPHFPQEYKNELLRDAAKHLK